MIFGIFGYILVPGMALVEFIGWSRSNIGISLILGFLLQLLNVFVAWVLYMIFAAENFLVVITILTALSIVVFSIFSKNVYLTAKEAVTERITSLFKKADVYLLLSLVLYTALAVYFQQYAVQPTSDGASYLGIARNVVENGLFKSNMVVPQSNWNNVIYSTGGFTHMFGYFAFASFFMFGGVSLISAKVMLMFSGALIIIVVFLLTKELLDRNTARLASFIVSTSAVFLTMTGLVGGPELVSALFVLFAFYLTFIGAKSNKKVMWLLAALSSFIAWYAWYLDFYAFLGVLLCLVAYFAFSKKESIKYNLLFSGLLFGSLLIDDRISSTFGLEKLGLPIPFLSLVMIPLVYLFSTRKKLKLPQMSLIIVSSLIILDFIFLSLFLTSPESHIFQVTLQNVGVTTANIASNVNSLSRAFEVNNILFYWCMHWAGVYQFIGIAAIFLAFISLARFEKIKETLLLASFLFFQALIWALLVVVDGFQPRYAIGESLFYDILAASALIFISRSATSHLVIDKFFSLRIKKKRITIGIKKLGGFFIIAILFISYFALVFQTYDNGKIIEQNWNFSQEFGWNSVINWVQNNTSPKDKLACIYGDYFSWYTNRQTAFLWDMPNKTADALVDWIQTLKINYLIVDKAFEDYFPDLSVLYTSPSSFLGSTISFISDNPDGANVIVYNVTNIAYGKFVTSTLEPQWNASENWVPLSFYSSGNVSVSENSVIFSLTAKETQYPSVAALFTLSSIANISSYSNIEFRLDTQEFHYGSIIIYSPSYGSSQNYFTYNFPNTISNEWVNISINLNSYSSLYGKPSLENVTQIGFVFGGFVAGDNLGFQISGLKFTNQEFTLDENST
jgi:hypothetical protein